MRICIFADQLFYAQPGGIGTYLRQLVPRMAERIEEGSLVLAHHGGKEATLPFGPDPRIEAFRIPLRRDLTGMAWHVLERPYLENYLGRLDLVHATSLVYPPSRAPLAATIHDLCVVKYPRLFPARWRAFHRRGLKLILHHARLIMADSGNTRRDLESLMGKADPRVRIVPLGVEAPPPPDKKEVEAVLGKHGLSPGYILFVGTIEPRKNLSRLVQAYASLGMEEKRKAGELVLVGAAGWMGRRELARVLSQQGVKWLGFLPQAELEAVYAAAGFFVYPSLYEGFGLPVLEAMARGLAVVTSGTSSLREVGEGASLLIDPEDPQNIASALERVIADPDLRGELARKGKERAAAFPWESTAELTLEVYKDAIAG